MHSECTPKKQSAAETHKVDILRRDQSHAEALRLLHPSEPPPTDLECMTTNKRTNKQNKQQQQHTLKKLLNLERNTTLLAEREICRMEMMLQRRTRNPIPQEHKTPNRVLYTKRNTLTLRSSNQEGERRSRSVFCGAKGAHQQRTQVLDVLLPSALLLCVWW
jgi:hypothetical protein